VKAASIPLPEEKKAVQVKYFRTVPPPSLPGEGMTVDLSSQRGRFSSGKNS
jgi:hypothetical protein